MKIICAGMWKTGTKSLARALRILGYKVYDYDDQAFEFIELWEKFFDGTVTDEEIRKALEDVDVLIDGPVICFWEEIHRAIPEAKVILTTRQDEDSWYRSLREMQKKQPTYLKLLFTFLYLTPTGRRAILAGMKYMNFLMGMKSFLLFQFTDNPRLYKYKFRQHNNHVIKTMGQSSNFLIYKPGDGWEPLCKFLGEDVPADTLYPHLNKEGAHFTKEGGPQNKNFRRALNEAAFALVVVIIALVGLCWLFFAWLATLF